MSSSPIMIQEAAFPEMVVVKHSVDYSTASMVANIATMIVSGSFWIDLIATSIRSIHDGKYSSAHVFQLMVSLVALAGIVYSFLKPLILNSTSIPIYGSDSISNSAMCINIVQGFHQQKTHTSLIHSIRSNLSTPSLTPDLIKTFNEMLLMNYETYGKIFTRLDTVDDDLSSIKNSVRSVESSTILVLGRTARTDVTIGQIRNQLNTIESNVESTNVTLGQVKAQVNHLEGRFDRLENQFVQFKEETSLRFDKLESKVDKLEVKVDAIEAKVDKLEVKVDAIEVKVDAIEAKVDAIEAKVDAIESKVDKLESKVDKLESKVDKLESKVDKLEVKVDAISKTRDEIKLMMEKFTFVVA